MYNLIDLTKAINTTGKIAIWSCCGKKNQLKRNNVYITEKVMK